MVPWPWPLAPLFLAILIIIGALVVTLVAHYVIREEEWAPVAQARSAAAKPGDRQRAGPARRLPIFPGFWLEILPALVLLWTGLIVAYVVTERDYLWTILPWATVTMIMLWPVGRRLGRPYLSYRSAGFVIGVISMAYIPFAGFGMISDLSFKAKSAIFFGLVADLTALGILPGLKWFIGRPIGMFFRPDLLFGDGRVLATGILALVLGLRYIIGSPAMGVVWPLPKWDWYAIFFAVVAGLIPLIAVRGMTKLLMRMRRTRDGAWAGWGAIFIREGLLVVTALAIGYGFHNAFMGVKPFTARIFTTDPDFWPALAIVLGAAFLLIFVRGAYKKTIGDPFIIETPAQTLVKQILLVVGLVALFYGFMSILSMDSMHTQAGVNGLRTWSNMAAIWRVGVPIAAWGLIVLIPVRVLIQHYQRHAIVGQMAAVIVPNQKPDHRVSLVRGMLVDGLLDMPSGRRASYMVTMNRALAAASDEARAVTTRTMVEVMAGLPDSQRDSLMETQVIALASLAPEERVTRMADMMGAVSQLPESQRRPVVAKMASLLT